jgi:hypothetical protein
MNSIAVIVKHMAGNMRSRWTDFLTSDGEKPDRDRDSEFVEAPTTREALLSPVGRGLAMFVRSAGAALGRGHGTDHYHSRRSPFGDAGHQSPGGAITRTIVGQIVLLAKHFKRDEWQSLSVPRRRSGEFNRRVAARAKPANGSAQVLPG